MFFRGTRIFFKDVTAPRYFFTFSSGLGGLVAKIFFYSKHELGYFVSKKKNIPPYISNDQPLKKPRDTMNGHYTIMFIL